MPETDKSCQGALTQGTPGGDLRICLFVSEAVGYKIAVSERLCQSCQKEGGEIASRERVKETLKATLSARVVSNESEIWSQRHLTALQALQRLRDEFGMSREQLQNLVITAADAGLARDLDREPVPEDKAMAWAQALGIDK